LLAAGAEAANPSLPPALEAAISSDSDFVARIDAAAVEKSPFLKALWGERIGEWTGRLAPSGLAVEDILQVVIAAPSAAIGVRSRAGDERTREVPTVVAVALGKPLDLEKLSLGLSALWEGRRTAERSRLGEDDVVALRGGNAEESVVYAALSTAKTTIFFSTDGERLREVLARERSGLFEKIPEELARLEAGLPESSQARTVMRPPALWRDGGSSPSTMSGRVLEPFREIQSLALAIDLAEEARLLLIGELRDENSARNLSTLLSTFILPNLQQVLSNRGGTALRVEDAFDVQSEGSTMRISLRIRPEDLRAMTAPR
jgi:hypothetical protein